MEGFKYLITTSRDQNSFQEEIKNILNSGNACCHSMQKLLSSRLLSKTVNNKTCRTVILLIVLHGCETWSLTSREECRLRMSENTVSKGDESTVEWRKLHIEVLNYLYSSPNMVWWIKSRKLS